MRAKKKGAKILIVDDAKIIREIVGYVLEERGFVCEDAGNGKEALLKVNREKPNIIILDIAMPEMDGFQTCKRLRGNPDTQDIPIIFLSAQKPSAEVVENMPGAAIRYIEKPCDAECLLKQIHSLLLLDKKLPN